MAVKFQRNYQLQIEGSDQSTIVVTPPLTVEFDIIRNILSSANTSSVRVLNLARSRRDVIRKNINDYNDLRLVQLRAGYGEDLPVLFSGNVNQAWSFREGVDVISQMECYDGGFDFVNANTARTVAAGTERKDIPAMLAQDFRTVKIGAVGSALSGKIGRGQAFKGSTMSLLREMTGGGFFVDNGRLNILADNEYIETPSVPVVNAASGLLGTPIWQDSIIHFSMLLEPNLVAGQLITLDSQTEPSLNGQYKVISLHHRGIISEAVGGEAVTAVGLLASFRNTELVPVRAIR